ncbi:hypothetical protein R6Z07M_018401 [Ovis aries]
MRTSHLTPHASSWAQTRRARPSVRGAPAPSVVRARPAVAKARGRSEAALGGLAGSVYLRDPRPPPAAAAAPREPGPEAWGEPRVVPAPSRPAQREKDSGVGTEAVPARPPAPRSHPAPESHQPPRHRLLRDPESRRRRNKSLGRRAVEGRAAGRRRSPSLGLGGPARGLESPSVPRPRRAACWSGARAPCAPPSAPPGARSAPRGRVALPGRWGLWGERAAAGREDEAPRAGCGARAAPRHLGCCLFLVLNVVPSPPSRSQIVVQTAKDQDWERVQQASVLGDMAEVFQSDEGVSDGEGDRVTLFSLATHLSPSGQADAKTQSVRLLDAMNEEISLVEEEKENTEQRAEDTESREGRGRLGSLHRCKSVSSLNLLAGSSAACSCPPLSKPRRRRHCPAQEGDRLGIMTVGDTGSSRSEDLGVLYGNRSERMTLKLRSSSRRAGPPGRTHQRPTQSGTCKGGWPLSGGRDPDAGAPPCEMLASARRGPGQGSLVNPDSLGPAPSENVHAGRGRQHRRCGRDTHVHGHEGASAVLSPLGRQRGARVMFSAAEGSLGRPLETC